MGSHAGVPSWGAGKSGRFGGAAGGSQEFVLGRGTGPAADHQQAFLVCLTCNDLVGLWRRCFGNRQEIRSGVQTWQQIAQQNILRVDAWVGFLSSRHPLEMH